MFLYFSSAFDTVWHEGLIYKLVGLGAGDPVVRLVASYLSIGQSYLSAFEWARLGRRFAHFSRELLRALYCALICLLSIRLISSGSPTVYVDDTTVYTACCNEHFVFMAVNGIAE